MSSQITTLSIFEPIYYHREYKNDLPATSVAKADETSWINTGQRITVAALPFISLYKPMSFPLSLVTGGLRSYTAITQLMESFSGGNSHDISFALLQTIVSVMALAGTIFAHPIGMMISTGNDLVLELTRLIGNLKEGKYEEAITNCLAIINNVTYLALFLHGSLELAAASFAIQVLVGLYHSQSEFRKGHYIEAGSHLLMSIVRGGQLTEQIKVIQFRNEFQQHAQTCLSKVDETTSLTKAEFNTVGVPRTYETYNVGVISTGGYNFHVAVYNDGTSIITCLDGGMRGYQAVAVNGIQVDESYNVQWYGSFFVHLYPNGKVTSYSNRQVAEVYA